jgi:hypothetical protein
MSSITKSSSRPCLYKTAVALSNMGVTLFERQRYSDAILIFREASSLVRTVFRPTAALPTESDLQTIIRHATNCLIQSYENDDDPGPPKKKQRTFRLKSLSDCLSTTSEILHAVHEFDATLVRIEDPTEVGGLAVRCAQAAAVLYNCGTACHALPQLLGDIVAEDRLLCYDEAWRCFRGAYRVLRPLLLPVVALQTLRSELIGYEIHVSRTLHLAVLLLPSLVQLCDPLGWPHEIHRYAGDFESVCHTIRRLQFVPFWEYHATAPVA